MLSQPARETVLTHAILENNLEPKNYLIEIRLPKGRPGFAEFRPGMNVIRDQFDVIAVDVVIHAACDRVQVIINDLARIEVLVLGDDLKLLRHNEEARLDVVTFRAEIPERRGARGSFVALTEVFRHQIERAPVKGCVYAIAFSFRRARRRESAQRTVAVHAQCPHGRQYRSACVPTMRSEEHTSE